MQWKEPMTLVLTILDTSVQI